MPPRKMQSVRRDQSFKKMKLALFKIFKIMGAYKYFVILAFIFSVITRIVIYKKTCYCCTNKRIIIRRGFIGADYQTLDYDLIGGMDVQVDFFDKIMKPNTGTISFASAASPMMEKQGSSYYFAHIENPYETYRKIKEYSSTYRDGKLNS